jgi:hypothetical protein
MVLKLAMLGETFASQLKENPQAMKDLEVVWAGRSEELFRAEVPSRRPDVLVVDIPDLAKAGEAYIPRLLELAQARRAVVTYRFAQRALVAKHTALERVRMLQGPLSLSLLRAHVFLFALDDSLPKKGSSGDSTMRAPASPPAPPKPPRYTPEQLGRLMEIASSVQCECPNHLAQLVSGLRAFEDYSKACESRDDKDRDMHALLYRQTASAREVMEEALAALVKHERIQL